MSERDYSYVIFVVLLYISIFIVAGVGIYVYNLLTGAMYENKYYLKYGTFSVNGLVEVSGKKVYYNCRVMNYSDGTFPKKIDVKCNVGGV